MNKKQQTINHTKGFTIIEVVLVLAIAGLIFLMVFIALPNLQKGQRDSQRKSDVARIATQVQNFQSSARGAIPDNTTIDTFVMKYLGGASLSCTGKEYRDPSKSQTGCDNYTVSLTAPGASDDFNAKGGTIYYLAKAICSDNGAGTTVTGTARQYALLVFLENQSAPYCLDNR